MADVEITLRLSAAHWPRLKAALQEFRDPDEYPDETDGQLARRWIKTKMRDRVYSYERDAATAEIAADLEVETP